MKVFQKSNLKPTFQIIALLIFFGIASSHALEMPFPTRELPFAVKDSKLESALEYGGPVKWMDNDRVIFSAFRKDIPRSDDPEGLRIVIWDTVKNTVTPYADGKLRCYNDGRIVYLIENTKIISRTESASKQKMGEMGKEQLVESKTGDLNSLLNPFSCNSYHSLGYTTYDEIHRPNPGMRILRLREDHGYLDLYTNNRKWVETITQKGGETGPKLIQLREVTGIEYVPENKYPIKYYRPGQPPIELGIVRGGITDRPVFSQYANAYVLDQLISGKGSGSAMLRLPDGQRYTVRLLSPEGEITTLTYPDALYQRTGTREINVSRIGLLIASVHQSFRPTLVDTGLFLARGEKVVKIMDGQVGDVDVSPDGCKVVFRHAELNNSAYPCTIKMINVCSGTN